MAPFNAVDIPLHKYGEDGIGIPPVWTGSRAYHLFGTGSNGKTFEALGVKRETDGAKLPKHTINAAPSAIAFNKFAAAPTGE